MAAPQAGVVRSDQSLASPSRASDRERHIIPIRPMTLSPPEFLATNLFNATRTCRGQVSVCSHAS
eukprot:3634316-Pyramimonas_sp.AAC.1